MNETIDSEAETHQWQRTSTTFCFLDRKKVHSLHHIHSSNESKDSRILNDLESLQMLCQWRKSRDSARSPNEQFLKFTVSMPPIGTKGSACKPANTNDFPSKDRNDVETMEKLTTVKHSFSLPYANCQRSSVCNNFLRLNCCRCSLKNNSRIWSDALRSFDGHQDLLEGSHWTSQQGSLRLQIETCSLARIQQRRSAVHRLISNVPSFWKSKP